MLNGGRLINVNELLRIACFLNVSTKDLTRIPDNIINSDAIYVLMEKVESIEGKHAIEIADKLSNLIIFHKRVRENATIMTENC